MPWGDWQIWQRYLVSPAALYDAYAYDIMIPIVSPPASVTDASMRKMWVENNAKRIDAVGRRGGVYTILEIRDIATWQTLGQVLGYQELARLHFPGDTWSPPVIIAGDVAAGLRPVLAAQGVALVLAPAPASSPAVAPARPAA